VDDSHVGVTNVGKSKKIQGRDGRYRYDFETKFHENPSTGS
jgi:hypothetical protein